MTSFVELLRHQFDKNADKPAIIHHTDILTFGQLESKARSIGALLQDKGLDKGDRVILYTPEKYPWCAWKPVLLAGSRSPPKHS